MKYWTEMDLTGFKYKENKSRKHGKITYIRTEAAFDIETTSTVVNGEKTAFMYIWMFGLEHGGDVYYGRTWDEFETFLQRISDYFKLGDGRRLVVYSHNLSFEFQFMRNELEWKDCFNLEMRKPLKAATTNGIEFRDSYILTGYSLEETANNLIDSDIKKHVGSLDYNIIRHQETPLTPEELAYCKADIQVITAYIREQLDIYNNIDLVPLTNTSRVRDFVRGRMTRGPGGRGDKRKWIRHQEMMSSLTLELDEYKLLKKAFQGGFVHANAMWVGETMENATGIDLTSAYPAVMLAEKFPMGKGEYVSVNSIEELEEMMKLYNVLFRVRFNGIKSSIPQENYISESKCERIENPLVNNGRVSSADMLETTITEVDYQIIKASYTWDSLQLAEVIRYPSGYLPKDFMEAVLELYEDKTELQGVKGKERQYTHSKGMLNSTFGMTVTDIVRSTISYKDGWKSESPLVKEKLKGYNTSKSRFLYYPWGVWITAYARKNLWSGILNFGSDYLYSDTDGIKLLNYNKHAGYIEAYNTLNKRKLERMCYYNNIDPKRLSPLTKDGIPVLLGAWEIDGEYKKFKTLGAKRYLVQEGDDVELTVAGVGKRSAKDYLLDECDGDVDKVFKMFNNELTVPKEYSNNLTHSYIDSEMEFEIQDYLGNTTTVKTKSGIHLEEVEFSLSLTSTYLCYIDRMKEGFILEGIETYNV